MRAWWVPVVALGLLACDDLPVVPTAVCGNRVVDSPTEDCDTFATQLGTQCAAPGTPNQCRYVCGQSAVCPTGMGCGADGVCRAAKGTFVAAGVPVSGTFVDVAIGDVDGDHLADVVGLEPLDFATTYFDTTLTSPTTVRLVRNATTSVHPVLRDINGDGRADLVAGFGNGTLVNLGSATRAFVPLASASSYIPNLTNAQAIVLKTKPPDLGDTLFAMATYQGVSAIALLQSGGTGALFTVLTKPPIDLAGPVAVGHLIENPLVSPCDELTFGWVGDTSLNVYSACVSDGMGGYMYNAYGPSTPTVVTLPFGTTLVRGPVLLDVNADGHLDLLVGASRCATCGEVDVAYGVGDGTFTGSNTFSVYPLVTGPLPLAMGDLNGDGVPDQVTEAAVLVSSVQGSTITFTAHAENRGTPWTEAVIADFNHDGLADVAAGSSAGPNLSFYNGDGQGSFSPFTLPSGAVRHLTVGDYDGDFVNDLAVTEVATASDTLGDSVSILWGNSVGAPDAPVSMGRFLNLAQMVAGHYTDPFGVLPDHDDLLTLSRPDQSTTVFGNFAGQGNRVLRSPSTFSVPTSSSSLASTLPYRTAVGRFVSASTPPDVVVIDNQYFPTRAAPAYRAWILPTDGTGAFDDANLRVVFAPLSDALDWSRAGVVAIDVDGSGIDQLVALGPSRDPTMGLAAVARYAPGVGMIFSDPVAVAAVVDHEETDATNVQTGRLLAADVDGDGNPDVVAIAAVSGVATVVVFWNDHLGQLGAMTALPNPNGHPAVDFAVLDAGGGGLSVAVLTDEGITLIKAPARMPVAMPQAFPAPNAHLVAAGDVNGDGVDDLVVAGDESFSVFQGQAVRP